MTKYLDIEELAALIGLPPSTIRRYMAKQPFNLPPKKHIPGSKMMPWRKFDVEKWLYEHGTS
ncbi:helix-turn-helix transcriptional regulator [Massilia aquatica]|uniref:Helix-turn-helix domain-containing protein n=1 Tax=Massilia aquatica TaxID=2609000 RepID=A0ABX0M915_9BURK|nr:helix-turn-helix domain-containing protein [Massilia aquatica]NHZ43649.1 hypothetical protein [Massilia aquatica]